MHQQAQLRRQKEEVEKLGAVALVVVAMDLHRTKAFKERNLLLSTFKNAFREETSLVWATALSDPAGAVSAVYGVSRRCLRWGAWVENEPHWFVIDRKGLLAYASAPDFSRPTSYEDDIDRLLEALRKAAG